MTFGEIGAMCKTCNKSAQAQEWTWMDAGKEAGRFPGTSFCFRSWLEVKVNAGLVIKCSDGRGQKCAMFTARNVLQSRRKCNLTPGQDATQLLQPQKLFFFSSVVRFGRDVFFLLEESN